MNIEQLARDAGMRAYQEQAPGMDGAVGDWEALTRFSALVRAQALEDAARHFDERDAGAGGYYLPHEPAQIIRALPPSE